MILSNKQITKVLIRLCICAGWSAPLLFANPRRQVFSRQGPYVNVQNSACCRYNEDIKHPRCKRDFKTFLYIAIIFFSWFKTDLNRDENLFNLNL